VDFISKMLKIFRYKNSYLKTLDRCREIIKKRKFLSTLDCVIDYAWLILIILQVHFINYICFYILKYILVKFLSNYSDDCKVRKNSYMSWSLTSIGKWCFLRFFSNGKEFKTGVF